jgi:dephospho-CoA kinase
MDDSVSYVPLRGMMLAARAAALVGSLDATMPVGCVVVVGDRGPDRSVDAGRIVGRGANGSALHASHGCERVRLGCASGEGYDLCAGCAPSNHAEAVALRDAAARGESTVGARIYLWGHYWVCRDCRAAIDAAGVAEVLLIEGAERFFDRNHPESHVGRQLAGPLRVAFGYRQRSGKDTSVERLVDRFGGARRSFAEPLYDILRYAQERLGFPQAKDRSFLQWVGTEWARRQDPNVFLRIALAADQRSSYISDMRFPNEFEACRAAGYVMVKLVRPGSPDDAHASETALDAVPDAEWDLVVRNDGTLDQLYAQIDRLGRWLGPAGHGCGALGGAGEVVRCYHCLDVYCANCGPCCTGGSDQ